MSNGKNTNHSRSSEPELSQDIILAPKKKEGNTNSSLIEMLLRLLNSIKIMPILMFSILKRFGRITSQLSKSIKRSVTIAALVVVAILAGHTLSAQLVSAQVATLPPLSAVPVPEPDNIGDFIRNKTAAIALGKALFWDMQLGTDGIQSCASCHFHAGADNRSKNQISPGNDNFTIGGAPNYQLTAADYPFHKLADPTNNNSTVLADTNDVAGSQGVFRTQFNDVIPGSDRDDVTPLKDTVFNVQGTNVRQVTGRNSPSVINAVFNFRNFWDGRAQNIFNGVNGFGARDPEALVLKASTPRRLEDVQVRLNNSSLASQAVGPPLAAIETFAEVPPIAPFAPLVADLSETDNTVKISDVASGRVINTINNDAAESTPESSNNAIASRRRPSTPTTPLRRFGRKLGKKLLAVQPLAKQVVAYNDSVLGLLSKSTRNVPQKGLNITYEKLIEQAFQPQWWRSNMVIRVDPQTGDRSFYRKPRKRPLSTIEYTLPEYNFSLFFGLAIQAYEATLISDQTPFDQFLSGKNSALTQQQQRGWQIFQNQGICIACHTGTELTAASVSRVKSVGRIGRVPVPPFPPEDTGFFNIGVRPREEDPGLGGKDTFGNSLSEATLAQQGKFQQIFGEAPPTLNPPLTPNEEVVSTGAFKAPGLRNVELTAPYFHNGGQLTLRQVVEFYNRGGDFRSSTNLIPPLNLTEAQKDDLVAFLRSLTDERVRYQKAPFDHPQLLIPNGHPGNQNSVVVNYSVQTEDGTQQAADSLLEIPAVGRNGGQPLPNFLRVNQ
ncbi:cytochrome-c peroxidase [Aulosira sp. FACHB-615]|uniref:cytochrome-c peroxidase n=1 Tax=Aulosira sp. FACHB-615 TaxID=2692777 RepID=UPI00168623F9|nr:cytochrome c peroxidase [Aulosira sp. FACHB-615]MBD2487672.1 cytochrome C peroxidase [Aulosira sp. FACHB-615]